MLSDLDPSLAEAETLATLRDDAGAKSAALRIRGLGHSYEQTPVLRDLTLHLPEGEYCCLLGDSGSGKTTLLKLIAGIERLQRGCIEIGGLTVADGRAGRSLPPEARHLGMVFQDQALWPHLSLQAHLEFPLRARRQTVDQKDLAMLIERMGLAGLEARKPGALSGGQRQRVGLARALAGNPKLLLLDEPLSAVDTAMRNELRGYLHQLFRELRFSALHVTHDPEEAFQLGTRIGVLEMGRLVQWDRPETLYRQPATRNVARLTGPCGIVGVDCVESDGREANIRWMDQVVRVPAHPDVRPGACSLLLRPDALAPSCDGLNAAVTSARFHGDRWLVEVAVEQAGLLPVFLNQPPSDQLSLRLVRESAWAIP